MSAAWHRSFQSLAVRNYRLYFLGQVVSVSGNWMQQVAIAWLVFRLTNSPFQLGLTIALQALPFLMVGVWGGLIVDRVPTRRLLLTTQTIQIVPPIILWILTDTQLVKVWMVFVLVFLRGALNAVDNPARQSFVIEMVGRERVVNAVSLNASVIQAGRLFGPAVAAIVIATLGLGPCFALNAVTFAFMILMLALMNPSELRAAPVAPRGRGQIRAGLAVAARSPELRAPLLMMAVVGLFAFNFPVVLPTIARFIFHGTATTYAVIMGSLAAGALVGSIVSGSRAHVSTRSVAWSSVAFGAALSLATFAPDLPFMLCALLVVGATSVMFSASVQATVQLNVAPEMRGRILSLYQLLYMGTTPLGALLVGELAADVGARSGLAVGGVAGLGAGIVALSAAPGRGGRAVRALGS